MCTVSKIIIDLQIFLSTSALKFIDTKDMVKKDPVADPGRATGAMAPRLQICTFSVWEYVPNKTFASLAQDIGPWLNILHLDPNYLNLGSATETILST